MKWNPFSEHKYPLLRNLLVIQFTSITFGILVLLLIYEMIVSIRTHDSLHLLKSRLVPVLLERQEYWRAWKALLLDRAISDETSELKNRFPIEEIKLVKVRDLEPVISSQSTMVVPSPTQLDPEDYVISCSIDLKRLSAEYRDIALPLLFILIMGVLFSTIFILSGLYIKRNIYLPILGLNRSYDRLKKGEEFRVDFTYAFGEMKDFLKSIEDMYLELKALEKHSALARVAAQVSHDIRSPLAALEVVAKSSSELPEDLRLLVRSAVTRVNDIANNLLDQNRRIAAAESNTPVRDRNQNEQKSIQLLSSLIDSLLTEKRTAFGSKVSIEIQSDIAIPCYGLFAEIQPIEFMRLLSNLVNNAVEALGDSGRVKIGLAVHNQEIILSVGDNGRGITPGILSRLGQRGETHGKQSGSGLGLYHARTAVESWGGSFRIESDIGKGTSVIIALPKAQSPHWFQPDLRIRAGSTIVVTDDDPSIHEIWNSRLAELIRQSEVKLFHFLSPDALRKASLPRNALYLMDFEFIGYRESGLDLIEELAIEKRSILVTNRFENAEILERCQRLGIRQIPKNLAGVVPIDLEKAIKI